ncbi:MAG: GDSL-type esterase/lipase family protein [Nitrospira sp.]|nr:GDSL-type esterase/lipase family protein [Nitrospira sp.]
MAGASIALIVGFLELLVVAGIVDFRTILSTPVREPWHHPDNLLDPKLLHIHKPHDRWLWNGVDYRYDQYGLRNDSDLNAADMIVVGDSFVEGLGVSSADLLTTHLAKYLNRPVANLGQSWYGPPQELELLRRYGLRLTPNVCTWVFFEGNDLADISRYKSATQDWETFSKDFHSFRQRAFTKNALLALDRLLISMHTQRAHQDSHETEKDISGIFTSSSGTKTRLYFHYKGHPLSLDDYSALEDLRSILTQAHEVCHAVGAKFLFVFAPTKFRVYKDFVEFDQQSQPRYWVTNDLPKEIEAMTHKALPDAGFLDLTTAFVEQARQGPLSYLDYDSHWSPEGHRVAATAIADFTSHWESNN